MKTPQYIFIHMTEVSLAKNPNQWEAVNEYHREKWGVRSSLGYYGGYNYEVAADGSIKQFRVDGEQTVSQYQQNMNDGRALSICMDGDFDIEDPTPAQKETVAKWLKEKMEKYGILKENVFPHRHIADKTCPGTRLPDDVYHYFCPVEIPAWAIPMVEKCKKSEIITDWSEPYEVLGTGRLETILEKAGFHDPLKHEGQETLLRFGMFLDRAGILDQKINSLIKKT